MSDPSAGPSRATAEPDPDVDPIADPVADPLGADADWRRLDIRMLLVHPVNELIRFLPLVIGIFFLGSQSDGGLWWHIGGIAIPIALGVLRFATTSFRITDGQIELRRGLISKRILTAPLDRVRTVELTASPIHRILGLAKVQIGTGSASKSGSEKLELDSLSVEESRALRVELLHWVDAPEAAAAVDGGSDTGSDTGEPATAAEDEVLMRLDPAWVRYAPLTTSGLVIALGALGAASQFLDRLANSLADRLDLTERVKEVPLWTSILVGIVIAVLVISILAMLGYVLTNWGFTLSRDRRGRSFHVRRGLLTTRETSIDRERVRGLEIHEPLGLRLVGAGRLAAIVTGLDRRSRGSTPIVPPAPRQVVVGVGERVLGETGPFTIKLLEHGPVARRRRYNRALMALAVVPVLTAAACALFDWSWWLLLPALLLVTLAFPLAADRYAGLGHALTKDYLVVRSGTFRGRRDALQRSGIIGWTVKQSWFQRRVGVVLLTATTAAGKQSYSAIDIPEGEAIALADATVPGLVDQFLA